MVLDWFLVGWFVLFCFFNHRGCAVDLDNYPTLTPPFLFCYLHNFLYLSVSSLLNPSSKLFDTDPIVFDTSVAAVHLVSGCNHLLMVLVRET